MRRAKVLILAGVFAASALGCGGKNEGGGTAASSPGGGAPSSNTKDIYVDKYKIGRTVMADGQAGTETDVYLPGESVYMSFVLRNLPSPSKVRIVFTDLAEHRKITELEKTTDKEGFVSFELKDTKSLKPGTYRAEYFLANE